MDLDLDAIEELIQKDKEESEKAESMKSMAQSHQSSLNNNGQQKREPSEASLHSKEAARND